MFRIAQEALNNVSKHACATAVEIRIEESKRRVLLSIADDGMGFQVPKRQPAAAQSWGMATMRERAEAVGAHFTLKAGPNSGVQVVVEYNA